MDSPRRRFRLVWCAVAGVLVGGPISVTAFVYGMGLGFSGSRDQRLQLIVMAVFFAALLLTFASALYIMSWAFVLQRPGASDAQPVRFTLGDAFGIITLLSIVLACVTYMVRGIRAGDGTVVVGSFVVGWEALGAAVFAPFHQKTVGVFLFGIILPFLVLAGLVLAIWIAKI